MVHILKHYKHLKHYKEILVKDIIRDVETVDFFVSEIFLEKRLAQGSVFDSHSMAESCSNDHMNTYHCHN